MIHIPAEEIRQPLLHADTLGFTFIWNGHFLRGIYPQSVKLARSYFDTGFLDEVVGKGMFPKTWISDFENEEFGIIIEHEMISPVTYATEWNSAMLKDAALMVLDIAEIGWRHGYNMVDCHKLNVMFRNNRPLYVDLGSFVWNEKGCTGWKPYHNFLESYTYILDVWTHGCPQLAKRMMSPGVTLHSEDYWTWKRPLYRTFPKLLRWRQVREKQINSIAILGWRKGGRVQRLLKSIIDRLKIAASQRFDKLRNGIERQKLEFSTTGKKRSIDYGFIQSVESMTVIGVENAHIVRTLHEKVAQRIISLNENDMVSNLEYRELKDITSVSYHLMNGGILLREKYPETRFQSEVVLAGCKAVGKGQFSLHNNLVYLERCMFYSAKGVMYVLLSEPNDCMVDMLRGKWRVERLSPDGTLIEVKTI